MKKKVLGILMALTMATGLITGCEGSAEDASTTTGGTKEETQGTSDNGTTEAKSYDGGDKIQLRIAEFTLATWNVAYNTAKGAGYIDDAFADSNVAVTITPFESGPAVNEGFLAGEVDMVVGMGDQPIISALAAGEVDNLVIAKSAEAPNMGVVAAQDSGIQSVDDLKGKTIAVPIGMAFHKALLYILQDAGIASTDVELVNISSYDEVIAAIDAGDIDAGFCWSTGYVAAENSDNYRIVADASEHPMFTYILTSRAYYEAYPETVKGFLGAVKKGAELFDNEPETAYAYIADIIGSDVETTAQIVGPNKSSLDLNEQAVQNLYDTSDFLVGQDLISNAVDPATIDDHIIYILDEIE